MKDNSLIIRSIPFVFYTKGDIITNQERLALSELQKTILTNGLSPKPMVLNSKLADNSHPAKAIAAEGAIPEHLKSLLPEVKPKLIELLGEIKEACDPTGGEAGQADREKIAELEDLITTLNAKIAEEEALKESAKTAHEAQVSTLTSEKEALAGEKKTLETKVKNLETENKTLKARVAELEGAANAASAGMPWEGSSTKTNK